MTVKSKKRQSKGLKLKEKKAEDDRKKKQDDDARRAAESRELKAKKDAAATAYATDVVARLQASTDSVAAITILQSEQDKIGRIKAGYADLFERIETAAANAGVPMREAS